MTNCERARAEYRSLTAPHSRTSCARLYGCVKLILYFHRTKIIVSCIQVENKQDRGKGHATRALQFIQTIADVFNLPLYLTPMQLDFQGLSTDELILWYTRHDFEFHNNDVMEYLPNGVL
jgi:hypothetical protein